MWDLKLILYGWPSTPQTRTGIKVSAMRAAEIIRIIACEGVKVFGNE